MSYLKKNKAGQFYFNDLKGISEEFNFSEIIIRKNEERLLVVLNVTKTYNVLKMYDNGKGTEFDTGILCLKIDNKEDSKIMYNAYCQLLEPYFEGCWQGKIKLQNSEALEMIDESNVAKARTKFCDNWQSSELKALTSINIDDLLKSSANSYGGTRSQGQLDRLNDKLEFLKKVLPPKNLESTTLHDFVVELAAADGERSLGEYYLALLSYFGS